MMKQLKSLILILSCLMAGCEATFAQRSNDQLPAGSIPSSMNGYLVNKTDTTPITGRQLWLYFGSGLSSRAVLWNDMKVYVAAQQPVFTSTLINNTSQKVGAIPIGGVVATAGQTLYQGLVNIFTETIHPHYDVPTAGISATPAPGAYQRGQKFDGTGGVNLAQINLSSTFTQNQGGSLTGTFYKQNGSAVGSFISSLTLTSTVTFTVEKTYNTGVCINNNLGVLDCTVGSGNAPNPAPVASGTAISAGIQYTVYDKRYAGFDPNALVSGVPAQSDILASPFQDNSGANTNLTRSEAQQGSNLYYYFITTGHVTSVTINGIPSTSSFNLNIPITFTNSVGGTFSGFANVSINPFGANVGGNTIVFN